MKCFKTHLLFLPLSLSIGDWVSPHGPSPCLWQLRQERSQLLPCLFPCPRQVSLSSPLLPTQAGTIPAWVAVLGLVPIESTCKIPYASAKENRVALNILENPLLVAIISGASVRVGVVLIQSVQCLALMQSLHLPGLGLPSVLHRVALLPFPGDPPESAAPQKKHTQLSEHESVSTGSRFQLQSLCTTASGSHPTCTNPPGCAQQWCSSTACRWGDSTAWAMGTPWGQHPGSLAWCEKLAVLKITCISNPPLSPAKVLLNMYASVVSYMHVILCGKKIKCFQILHPLLWK